MVDELIPGMLSLGEVQRVLQGLLAERVPIRDLRRIFEALTLRAKVSTDPEGLSRPRVARSARRWRRPTFTTACCASSRSTRPRAAPHRGPRPTEEGTQLVVDPDRIERLLGSVRDRVQEVEMAGREAVVVCAPGSPALRKTIALALPTMPVLSYTEVTCTAVQVETVGVVSDAAAIVA